MRELLNGYDLEDAMSYSTEDSEEISNVVEAKCSSGGGSGGNGGACGGGSGAVTRDHAEAAEPVVDHQTNK